MTRYSQVFNAQKLNSFWWTTMFWVFHFWFFQLTFVHVFAFFLLFHGMTVYNIVSGKAGFMTLEQALAKKNNQCFLRGSAGWKLFYHSPARIVECVSEYTFLSSKHNETKKRIKKTKETNEEMRISTENRLKKTNLQPPGWRFFSSPTFPKTEYYFFWSHDQYLKTS